MRKVGRSDSLSVHAIAGSRVVMLHMDLPEALADGLLGFSIRRDDGHERRWLRGYRTFQATDPGRGAGTSVSTWDHPIQDFSWSDYTVEPGQTYTYRIVARGGRPEALTVIDEVSVEVTAELEDDGVHAVHFNRGVAASQAYRARYGDRRPGEVGEVAWRWLSRGAEEAILGFVDQAERGDQLRVCAYEFRLPSFAAALRCARGRGVEVGVVYDCTRQGQTEDFPTTDNRAAALEHGLQDVVTERVTKPKAISHHKFIVRARDGVARTVLLGSTNFSAGGVFGQSNVVHVCRDPQVASTYLEAWELLAGDGRIHRDVLSQRFDGLPLAPAGGRPALLPVFSPRSTDDALTHYASLIGGARGAVFGTFAFGMNEVIRDAYRSSSAPLRYASLDKLILVGRDEDRNDELREEMLELRRLPENRFAVGSYLPEGAFGRWLGESLSGLNTHVKHLHTKILIVDPLGPDPIVVTGSANFSEASCVANDENMLIIHGDPRVADLYLGEYMRIWEHHAFREWAATRPASERDEPWWLFADGSWTKRFFEGGHLAGHRAHFAAPSALAPLQPA